MLHVQNIPDRSLVLCSQARPAVTAKTRVAVSPVARDDGVTFFDAGLDNPNVPEDSDAVPPRKCASCFG